MHEFIRTHRDQILSACLDDLKGRYPDRSETDLFDDVPGFLDETEDALRRDATSPPGDGDGRTVGEARAAEHGAFRKMQGFDISRVIHDYGMVCDRINDLAVQRGAVFDTREHQILNRCIDDAAASAVEAFVSATHTEQSERLGFIAHEIRNAAWTASVSFDLISKGQVGAAGRTGDVLQRSLTRIGELAEHALTEARLAARAVALHQVVLLSDLVQQVIVGSFPERGIRIESEVEPDLQVEADPSLLGSALNNLLQNAIKFTHANQTIVLRARSLEGAVQIEVEDRCGGLPGGATEELFQSFVRKSTSRRGVGLGLAIARRAVEAHGGTLTVRNLPSVGCVFTILFPRTVRETS